MRRKKVGVDSKFPVCLACRRYGVPLIDKLCQVCYYSGDKPRTHLQPGILPYPLPGGGRTTLPVEKLRDL